MWSGGGILSQRCIGVGPDQNVDHQLLQCRWIISEGWPPIIWMPQDDIKKLTTKYLNAAGWFKKVDHQLLGRGRISESWPPITWIPLDDIRKLTTNYMNTTGWFQKISSLHKKRNRMWRVVRERERETVELVVDAAAATPRTYKLASTHYALSINVYPNIDMYNI